MRPDRRREGRPARARGGARDRGESIVERPPESALGAAHDDEVGELAAALIAFEGCSADDAPDAVLLVSASNLALAAVLVATKLRIPVVALVDGAGSRARCRR